MVNPKSSRSQINRIRLSDAGFHTFLNIAIPLKRSMKEGLVLIDLDSKFNYLKNNTI